LERGGNFTTHRRYPLGQTLLGLGFATVVAPPDGAPALRVAAMTAGVRVAGVRTGVRRSHNDHLGTLSRPLFG
jgi:hypothetical protein